MIKKVSLLSSFLTLYKLYTMALEAKNIIRFARCSTIEPSRSQAVLALDNFFNRVGQPVVVRYYRDLDNDPTEIDLILAIGLENGVGRNTYKIIFSGALESLIEDVWTTPGEYPDVSLLSHGEIYIVKNEDDQPCYCYAVNNERQLEPITGGPFRYVNLSDGLIWYYKDGGIRCSADIYSQEEIDEKIENGSQALEDVVAELRQLISDTKTQLTNERIEGDEALDRKIDARETAIRTDFTAADNQLSANISEVDSRLAGDIQVKVEQIYADLGDFNIYEWQRELLPDGETAIEVTSLPTPSAQWLGKYVTYNHGLTYYLCIDTERRITVSDKIAEVDNRYDTKINEVYNKIGEIGESTVAEVIAGVDHAWREKVGDIGESTVAETIATVDANLRNKIGDVGEGSVADAITETKDYLEEKIDSNTNRITAIEEGTEAFQTEIREEVETFEKNVTETIDGFDETLDRSLSKIGVWNYLLNSSFCGDYETVEFDESSPVSEHSEIYSDAGKYWNNVGEDQIIPEPEAQSGFAIKLPASTNPLWQTISSPSFELDEYYTVSYKINGSATVSFDENEWTDTTRISHYHWTEVTKEEAQEHGIYETINVEEFPAAEVEYYGKYLAHIYTHYVLEPYYDYDEVDPDSYDQEWRDAFEDPEDPTHHTVAELPAPDEHNLGQFFRYLFTPDPTISKVWEDLPEPTEEQMESAIKQEGEASQYPVGTVSYIESEDVKVYYIVAEVEIPADPYYRYFLEVEKEREVSVEVEKYYRCDEEVEDLGWEVFRHTLQWKGHNTTFSIYGTGELIEPKVEIGSVGTSWAPNAVDTDPVAAKFNDYKYLTSTFAKEQNQITFNNIASVGKRGVDSFTVKGGFSGSYNDDSDAFIWSGSDYNTVQAFIQDNNDKKEENPHWFVEENTVDAPNSYIPFSGQSMFNNVAARGEFRGLFVDGETGEKLESSEVGISGLIDAGAVVRVDSFAQGFDYILQSTHAVFKFEKGYLTDVFDSEAEADKLSIQYNLTSILPEICKPTSENYKIDLMVNLSSCPIYTHYDSTSLTSISGIEFVKGRLVTVAQGYEDASTTPQTENQKQGFNGCIQIYNTNKFLLFAKGRLVKILDSISELNNGLFTY